MTLGERIREQRQRAGLSQEKVAELTGVSRQAVTKWETGQSAPNTDNLFKLAEIFGTTVDLLLADGKGQAQSEAERFYVLYKQAAERLRRERRDRIRKRILAAVLVAAGYLAVLIAALALGGTWSPGSAVVVLHGPRTYLVRWLLIRGLFWFGMALSGIPALLGRWRFSVMTLGGFAMGVVLGELFGPNPAGAHYGDTHYGWAIWILVFLASIVSGIVLERLHERGIGLRTRGGKLWLAATLLAMAAAVVFVRLSIPQHLGV